MKRIISVIRNNFGKMMLLGVTAGFMASCNSVLDFNEGDCTYQYKVKFKYDYNMKYADAFHSLVSTVTLYAFDQSGKFVYQKTDEGAQLKPETYAMTLDNLTPGTYHFVTWAGLDNQSFAVPLLTPGTSTLTDLTVKTRRVKSASRAATSYGSVGENVVDHQLADLWHGEIASTEVLSRSRDTIITVPLIKNTNTVRIVIVQAASAETMKKATSRAISSKSFSYNLSDNNGYMNYDNTLLADSVLTYEPYLLADSVISTTSADKTAEALKQITGRSETTNYNAAVAEISTARLLTSQTPKISITNATTGKELLPTNSLISILNLLKESNYSSMPLQEYLDREDHFDVVLFVNEQQTLLSSVIVINNWIVQLNNIDL